MVLQDPLQTFYVSKFFAFKKSPTKLVMRIGLYVSISFDSISVRTAFEASQLHKAALPTAVAKKPTVSNFTAALPTSTISKPSDSFHRSFLLHKILIF
jgi:hypothetical protein